MVEQPQAQPRPVFEPQLDPTAAAAQLAVLGTVAAAAAYWWLVVVPSERGSLARDKRKGAVGQYLQVRLAAMGLGQARLSSAQSALRGKVQRGEKDGDLSQSKPLRKRGHIAMAMLLP